MHGLKIHLCKVLMSTGEAPPTLNTSGHDKLSCYLIHQLQMWKMLVAMDQHCSAENSWRFRKPSKRATGVTAGQEAIIQTADNFICSVCVCMTAENATLGGQTAPIIFFCWCTHKLLHLLESIYCLWHLHALSFCPETAERRTNSSCLKANLLISS